MNNLLKWIAVICLLSLSSCGPKTQTPFERLQQCFQDALIDKKIAAIAECYDKDLIIYTNGLQITYDTYLKTHSKFYDPAIKNQIQYDKESVLQNNNRLAVRLWLITQAKNNPPTKMEVVLIAEFRNNKIYRIWELTNPPWKKS